jgi:hypothetical protein
MREMTCFVMTADDDDDFALFDDALATTAE